MNRAIGWFAGNDVAANLLMLVIVFGGGLTLLHVKLEVFPEFSTGLVNVTVEHLGAAPEEVEEGVCVRIEEAVQDVDGVKRITSTASEGLGTVSLELMVDADVNEVLDRIKNRVDAIDTFPEEAEKPVIQEILTRHQVIDVAISGRADERTLKRIGEQIRDEISALPGITQVVLNNARPYEVSVEVSEEALRRHGLTLDAVALAVRRSSLDLPGGSVKTADGDVLLRTKGQAYRRRDFEKIVLLTDPDGTRVLVEDVARVVDGFEDTDQSARFNGEPAVVVQVFRVGDQNALHVADSVKDYVAKARGRMPEGISLTVWQDNSQYLRGRRDLLLKNALYGLILVFFILTLFLRLRLAIWVTLGIPVSFLGAIWLMPHFDVSVNMISLFAFILVLGIVVDDAIVVGENVHTFQSRTGSRAHAAHVEASTRGTQEVAMPVIFAVLTSVAAMIPLLNVSGTTGKIMRVIPLVIIPALLFSLIESLFVLPNHLSHGDSGWALGVWVRFRRGFGQLLERFVHRVYRPFLDMAIRARYLTLSLGIAVLLVTLGLVAGGRVNYVYFPKVDADYITTMLTMPQGTATAETEKILRRIESAAFEVQRDLSPATKKGGAEGVFRHVLSSLGEQPQRIMQAKNAGKMDVSFSGGHLGEVTMELVPAENRTVSNDEIIRRWGERIGSVPGAEELSITSSIFSPGKAIEVELAHRDLGRLEEASEALRTALTRYPGVYNLASSHQSGKREVRLSIRPEAEVLGLSQADLARQVRQSFYGAEAQRIQRGRDDVRVMVRYPVEERDSLGDLENMRVRTPDGREVPFREVASVRHGRGFATIRRADRRRTISITADVDDSRNNANKIIGDMTRSILPELQDRFPGLKSTFEGQSRDQRETMSDLFLGFAFAIFAIYALLAVPFRSYLQPFLVLSAIPFGLVGAVWGHVVLGETLTVLSMFGLVALTGVVVNDSLVLVHYVNRTRAAGTPLLKAVGDAAVSRFRPILLTSLTTFGGLTPLLLERSVQAKFLIPMAISLAFGVMFATGIILVLVPAMYQILEDLKRAIGIREDDER